MTLQLAGDGGRAEPCIREALELNRSNGSITNSLYSVGSMAFGAIAAGDIAGLRAHTVEVVDLLRRLGGKYEEPGWLWWAAVALASGEGRYRSALRLAGAADAVARRDGLHLHEQLRRLVQPWLERARAEVGSAEAGALGVEGSQLSTDELLDEALRDTDHPQRALAAGAVDAPPGSDGQSGSNRSPAAGSGGSSPLSTRELEVADLVARGLTNREIAQHLVISTRTVESHVDHIKAKLGFGRRARIVAWALTRAGDNGARH
jgi:DNA-binding NarL/FixJ family response regulator